MMYTIDELVNAAEKAGEPLEFRKGRTVISRGMCEFLRDKLPPYYVNSDYTLLKGNTLLRLLG